MRHPPGWGEPHYAIACQDYVGVVALTCDGELLLVRQFRPALWERTLEIPAGHVEPGQTPEQAARAELLEETGHEAPSFEPLGVFAPDTGRMSNRMWGFFAANAAPTRLAGYRPEAEIEVVRHRGGVRALTQEQEFKSALNRALLFEAVAQGKLAL